PPQACASRASVWQEPSARQRTGGEALAGDLVNHVLDRAADAILGKGLAGQAPADPGHRLARDDVVGADAEHDPVDEAERVLEHQPLEFDVVTLTPAGARQEAPADLQRALFREPVAPLEARGADY